MLVQLPSTECRDADVSMEEVDESEAYEQAELGRSIASPSAWLWSHVDHAPVVFNSIGVARIWAGGVFRAVRSWGGAKKRSLLLDPVAAHDGAAAVSCCAGNSIDGTGISELLAEFQEERRSDSARAETSVPERTRKRRERQLACRGGGGGASRWVKARWGVLGSSSQNVGKVKFLGNVRESPRCRSAMAVLFSFFGIRSTWYSSDN